MKQFVDRERAREAIFAVTIPEEAGAFRAAIGQRVVSEFNYQLSGRAEAHIFVDTSVESRDDARALAEELRALGHETVDLSDDEMATVHVRYMVGGRASEVRDEWPCPSNFPNGGRSHVVSRCFGRPLEHQPLPLPQPRL